MKKDEIQASFDPVYLLNNSPRFGRQFSRGITLAPHQQAMLQRCLQIERLPQINDTYGKVGIMGSRPGSGKCHGVNTPILMYDGSIKMVQDVIEGDRLMGDDSTPRRVLSLARGRDKMFEVTPSWGDKYIVNQEHVLCLLPQVGHRLPEALRKYTAADGILEIPVNALDEASCSHMQCFRTGVEFESRPVNFDPYIIGLWLGSPEGLVSRESAVLHHLNKTLPGYDMHLDFQKTGRYYLAAADDVESTLHAVLGEYNMLRDRHIAPQYKCNERCIRLQVLAGLIDSNARLVGGGYEIVEEHARLRDDIVFLARSLGLCCKVESRKIKICGEGLPYIPVKVPKKRAAFVKSHLNDWGGISVRAIGDGDYYGFTLDGNNRYLLSDFSVTHNTATTLSLIAASKFNGDAGPDGLFVNLVVVPQAIMTQWKNELDSYNGNDNILTYKMFGEYADISGLYFKRDIIRDYDVLITHSMFYKVIVDVAKDIGLKLHRMIVDEIDGACWCVSGKANAEITWYISATFADACESKGYIGQLMTTVPVHVIRDRVCICRDDFIDESFYLPDPISTVVTCKNKHLDYLLTGFLTKPVLSCLNAGHYSSIKNKFHPVFAKNEQQVVGILMYNASETVRRTQQCLDDIIQRSNEHEKSSSQYPNITPEELAQMRKTIEDAKASEKEVRRVVQDNDLCLICFNFIGAVLATAPCCCSSFCSQCVHRYLESNDKCPACHTGNLRPDDLFIESNSRPLDRSTVGGLHTKIDAVTEIVRNTDGNKVLIFSEYADCFDDLEVKLSSTNCKVLIMNKGDVDGINATVDAYRNAAEKCVLMVCSDHFGRGLNLEMTSDIVFLHRMPETLTTQVIGRAQRLNRSGVLKLWHTLYENEA